MTRTSVPVGDGQLDAVLEGIGPVTVVFENGLATPLEEWDGVVSAVSGRARTLRYDHRSAAPRGRMPPRSITDVLGDLETLLETLTLKPPYVFVGHSWGGVVARLFACRHPNDVVGLVFVDATHEAIDSPALAVLPAMYSLMLALCRMKSVRLRLINSLCPPRSPAGYRARIEERLLSPDRWSIGLRTARAEASAIHGALAQLRRDCPDLPAVPVQILSASSVNSRSARTARDAWKAMADRSPSARFTNIPNSGHYLPIEAPNAVIGAINGVLDDMRIRQP